VSTTETQRTFGQVVYYGARAILCIKGRAEGGRDWRLGVRDFPSIGVTCRVESHFQTLLHFSSQSRVGKTSLMHQYVNKQFAYSYKATIGTSPPAPVPS
jgi:hypothetical protein